MRRVLFLLPFLIVIGIGWFFFNMKFNALESHYSSAPTRTITEKQGRKVAIPIHPQRIVIISPSGLDMFLAVDGKERLVGYASYMSMTKEIKEATKDLPSVGTPNGVSLEKIITLHPDLVIGITRPNQEQMRDSLEQAGIPVLLLDPQSFQENLDVIQLFGELLNKEDQANQVITEMKKELEKDKIARLGKKEPSVLMILGTSESFFMTTPHSLNGDFLQLAGGQNIAAKVSGYGSSNFIPISLEFVLTENPDYIFFISHGSKEKVEKNLRKNLLENDAWSSIPAIRENRMQVVPSTLFSINPGSHSLEAIQYLSQILYPK